MKEKPELELEEKVEKVELRMQGEKIEPNKWYGICYGRDLPKEIGVNYQ